MPRSESWRQGFNHDSVFRQAVEYRILQRFREGRKKGLGKYGPDFAGDPLQHAFEEACDLVLYLAVELERRETAGEQPSREYLTSLLRKAYWFDMYSDRFCPFCFSGKDSHCKHEAGCPAPEIETVCGITTRLDRMEAEVASD